MTYLRHGAEYLDGQEMQIYRAVQQLNTDGRTTNNSQLAAVTGWSRTTIASATAHLRARGYLTDTGKGSAYHWRTTGKPAWTHLSDAKMLALSDAWQAAHQPVDGDNRSPLEVYEAGLITYQEFLELTVPAGFLEAAVPARWEGAR